MIRNIILSALASLKRKKMVSLFTILTISLGMTMIILLASLYNSFTGNIGPYQKRDRTLYLVNLEFIQDGETVERERDKHATTSFINQYLQTLETPELIGLYGRPVSWNLGTRYKPFNVKYLETDANFWKIHQFHFLSGRGFLSKEIEQKEQVCILSQKAAGFLFPDDEAVGKYYPYNGKKLRIVGVIRNEHPHFEVAADLYVPYPLTIWEEDYVYEERHTGRKVYFRRGGYKGVVLLGKGTATPSVKKEFNELIRKVNKQGKVEEFEQVKVKLRSPAYLIPSLLFRDDDTTIIIMVGIALCFLLVPIVILSNINLYALRDRMEEIGIRKSFGAGRRMIVLQFMMENVMLTLIGGLVALFLAFPLNQVLSQIIFHTREVLGMEFNFTFFSLLICGAFIFGIVTVAIPAYRISRMLPAVAIQHHFRNHSSDLAVKSRKKWPQVFTHFILFSVLLFSVSYISIIYLRYMSGVGYNTRNVITFMLDQKGSGDRSNESGSSYFAGLREKLLQVPGVEQVSYVLDNPPSWIIPQYQKYDLQGVETEIRTLETDSCFFPLLEMKPHNGEFYKHSVYGGKYIPAVATREAEKRYFDGDAMGKTFIRKKDGKRIKIIGLIEKYRHHQLATDFPGIFTCRNQPCGSMIIKYSFESNPDLIEEELKKVVYTHFPNGFITQNDDIGVEFERALESTKPTLYGLLLSISFLVVNALLGFFTLIWYNVRSRKKEMGIRRAAGATSGRVQRKILWENLLLMLIGSAVSAILITQLIVSTVREGRIKYYWIGLSMAFLISLVMTLLSAWIPARNAGKVQPVEALKEE